MKGLSKAIWTESLKARRSKILWISIAVFSFIAVMMGLLVFIANHPALVGDSVVMSAKASMIGNADWPAYFELLYQVAAMIGLIGFGFIISWTFGREYSDRTLKDILALPVSRYVIVLSKFIVITIWSLLLTVVLFGLAVVTGLAVNIPGWMGQTALHAFFIFVSTAMLTLLICTPLAFLASCGRGYLLPIGFIILIVIITQFLMVAIPGFAPYIPWAIPALYCGAAGPTGPHIGAVSYMILLFTSILGIIMTLAWWRFADAR
jgi:ABC-2 type transport system permease protein